MKLFWKIYLAVFASFVAVVAAISYGTAARQISEARDRIVDEHTTIGSFVVGDLERRRAESQWPFENLAHLSRHDDFLFWWIVEEDGTIHLADQASFIGSSAFRYFPEAAAPAGVKDRVILNRQKHYGLILQSFGTGQRRWSFWLGFSTAVISQVIRRIVLIAVVSSTVALAVLAIVLYLTIKYFTEPIQALTQGAAIIGNGDLTHRVPVTSDDELGWLARVFNGMAEHLETTMTSIDCLNREIAERTKVENELATMNQELKDFAYVVSHDLKAPLRGIRVIVDWLRADYLDGLDDQGKEYLTLLTSRADRMQDLIDGVLQYSRIGRTEQGRTPVALGRLVPEIVETLDVPEHISIQVAPGLPTVEAEETRIMQVFQNLLSNAIKYLDKPQGRIAVACTPENGFWRFSVSDNGPGIEPKHFERIFKLFQTLSRRDDRENTGVGLTIAKKIVEMYGGRIWVESQIGQGTTFFFTWPKQQMEVRDAQVETNMACPV